MFSADRHPLLHVLQATSLSVLGVHKGSKEASASLEAERERQKEATQPCSQEATRKERDFCEEERLRLSFGLLPWGHWRSRTGEGPEEGGRAALRDLTQGSLPGLEIEEPRRHSQRVGGRAQDGPRTPAADSA